MNDSPLLSRRRLLAAMAFSPLLLPVMKARAGSVDLSRIVALEWLPVELLLTLGVTPYGVADIPNYRLWVNQPALPDSVIDVGLRTEPNLELLTELKPSYLFWSAGYGPAASTLARIAHGRGFNFSDGRQPLQMARRSLTEMGQLLGLESRAQQHLSQFDSFVASYKPRFAARGGRPLLLISVLDARHVLVFGRNGLFQPILDEYGIVNAWQGETNFWGSEVVGIDRLGGFRDADVLCFEHGNDADVRTLTSTPLWQAMPFVRQRRLQFVPAVWFYGATLSVMNFIRILDRALGGQA